MEEIVMRPILVSLAVLGAAAFGSSALAQTSTTVVTQKPSTGAAVGVAGGAATGAVVGGPVGAVVGGVVGGVAGALADPPAEVRTYVQGQTVPVVTYEGDLVVGQPLPGTITVYDIPNQSRYSWAYVNGQRVLIDRSNRHIVGVVGEPGATAATSTTVTTTKPSGGAAAGAVTGAATGAVVGGPVGAAVGGVVGAVAGAVADPPEQVTTYVRSQTVPPATYSGQVVVGQPFPVGVTAYDVPSDTRYRWAFVNEQRVLIDRSNGLVVAVLP
jgi:uncharacterized membrane protein